jgi:ATP-dependent helicase/nuclease subunit A
MTGPEQLGLDFGDGARAGASPPPTSPSPPPPPPPPAALPQDQDATEPAELPDQIARRRIVEDLDANLLVEAGAGSGKTTALVSRMVALVRAGTPVHQIAAVTFTRKAAGELRERFQEALERARGREEAAPEERARLDAALREVDRAYMGTIHSFCARLLRERPLDAGIDPGFTETTPAEARLHAGRFWSVHLERLSAEGDPILGELDDVGIAFADLRRMYEDVSDFLDVEFPVEPEPPPDPATIARVRGYVEGILDAAAQSLPRQEPENEWDEVQNQLRSILYKRRYGRWDDDRVFLDALAELGRKTGWKVVQYKWVPNGRTGNRCAAAKTIEDRINRLGVPGSESRELIEQWWAHRYPIAMRFVLGAARALEAERLQSARLDFQDLLTLSAKLLRSHPAARRDLGERWRRLLVDEFQDTDPLQAEVLFLLASEPIAADWEPGAAADWSRAVPRDGALFVVGDPKQSIYRFRRADIALYMRVRERFREFGGVLELIANFRSLPSVARIVNDVFAGDGGFPWEATPLQAAFAPLEPQKTAGRGLGDGVFHYFVDGETRDRIAAWDAEALADWIARRIAQGRTPGEFLVLTRTRLRLDRYAAALEARNLPVQVSGAGVGVEEVVAELKLLLEALADPDDAAKTVAVLVGLFFGLDHDQLLAHALAGRSFDLRVAREGADDPVEEALLVMRRWAAAGRKRPADVTIGTIADELGLLAHAAAGELGAVRAGALAFVLDAVRGAGLNGDTSITAALEALDAALVEEEAEAPLEAGRSDVVRLMNLHKAKGLEAAVVVLAEPSGEGDYPPDRHIERTPDGRARGWFSLTRKEEGRRSAKTLARPRDWPRKEAAERAFDQAEDLRLLYVAATRAAEELVIARQPGHPERSPWGRFEPWLDEHGQELALDAAAAPARDRLERTAESLAAEAAAAAAARKRAQAETFRFASVTSLVKEAAGAPATVSDTDRLPVIAATSTGPGGYEWGSAVHGVLEAAARGASGDPLRAVARSTLLELDRPVREGEPAELGALMDTVNAVRASRLWKRAEKATRTLAEVPFALGLGGDTWLEGVVDLAFREPDGWVLVDYKTDRGDDPEFATRRLAYREQLRRYADAWARLTGEPVKERVILWTRQRTEEPVT